MCAAPSPDPGTQEAAEARRGARRMAILGFHKIGEPPGGWNTWFYICESVFERQLCCLREEGWHVIDVDAFLSGLADPETLPERSALITFDDGYRSNLEVAVPLLQRFGYPAVIFVPTAFIGRYNAFDADLFYEPKEPICTWEELRTLEREGVSVQSHGVSHRRFLELGPEEQEQELLASKTALEEGLGKRVELFSFPYGDPGADPRRTSEMLTRTGYEAAFLYGGGPVGVSEADRFGLMRLAMGPDTDLRAALEEA